jgi:hypothetical protein
MVMLISILMKTLLAYWNLEANDIIWIMLLSTLLGVYVFFQKKIKVNGINRVMLIFVLIIICLVYWNLEANDIKMDYVDISITWCLCFLLDYES